MAQYNNGNIPFELHIRKNTTITNLGKQGLINTQNVKLKPTELCDVLNNSTDHMSKSVFFSITLLISLL